MVVSPGSRSTPLAMVAHEAHKRFGATFRLYVDVDERGAGFFALGLAKASGRAVALICTSGTAVANYYPAVLEAETSRVPLIVLTGDRPARLQKLGAPQTCDQNKVYSDHVRRFFSMLRRVLKKRLGLYSSSCTRIGSLRRTWDSGCISGACKFPL